jgi:ABC-type polysaccharide/polyol phosphate export permease
MPVKILIALINCLILFFTLVKIYGLVQKSSFIESKEVLRLPISFPIAGYACMLLTPVLIILPIYFKDISPPLQVLSNVVFLILCRVGYHLIVFHHNHRLFYTNHYFEVQSFKGHLLSQAWNDVASIENERLTGRLFLTNQDGTFIKISCFLRGYDKFYDYLTTQHSSTESIFGKQG